MLSRYVIFTSTIRLVIEHTPCLLKAAHKSTVKALYAYEATAPGELTIEEDEVLQSFFAEEEWLLVQSESAGGKAGFVPSSYVEEVSSLKHSASRP